MFIFFSCTFAKAAKKIVNWEVGKAQSKLSNKCCDLKVILWVLHKIYMTVLTIRVESFRLQQVVPGETLPADSV